MPETSRRDEAAFLTSSLAAFWTVSVEDEALVFFAAGAVALVSDDLRFLLVALGADTVAAVLGLAWGGFWMGMRISNWVRCGRRRRWTYLDSVRVHAAEGPPDPCHSDGWLEA